jgi:hypothetical protein
MAAAFTKETTAMRFEVANKIDALHTALRRQQQALTYDGGTSEVLLNLRATSLEHQLHCFPKIVSGFFESLALSVRARKLFDEGDISSLGVL